MLIKVDGIILHSSTKKRSSHKCDNHRTISLISHPIKVLLQIINNQLENVAKKFLAEEQASFEQAVVQLSRLAVQEY